MQNIMVVEDDRELNQGICYALRKYGFSVIPAYSIEEARNQIEGHSIQMILLDVNLPDGDGYDFCKEVQKKNRTPVMFLTARDLEEDAIEGYEAGADDYVTKPFSMKILIKKINVVLKHSEEVKKPIFDDGYLKVDVSAAKVEMEGESVVLTPTEFRLLHEFISHKGQLLTYEVLLERLWDSGSQFVDKHALAVNMNRLRKKIENEQHKYISNVYGMGYQWIG